MTPEEQAIRADERRKCVEEIRAYSERWNRCFHSDQWFQGVCNAADCINRDWPRLSKIKNPDKKEQVK